MQLFNKLNALRKPAKLLMVMLLALFFASAYGDTPSNIDDQRNKLLVELAAAETELDGRLAEDAVWQFWFDQAPNPEVRTFLDAAIERREAYDFEAAEKQLDNVVNNAPDFAEGYNQRAFIRFLRENFVDARTDLEATLELEPKHFGALAGLYQIHSRLGEQELAFSMLQQAVTIHPWLKERHALPKKLWPESYRRVHVPSQEI